MAEAGTAQDLFDQLGLNETRRIRTPIGWLVENPAWRVVTVLFSVLVVLGPIIALETSEGANEGSLLRQLGYIVMLIAAIAVAGPWHKGWRALAVPWPLLLVFAWFAISMLWSIAPGIGIRRLLLTATVSWTCIIIGRGAGYQQTIDNLRLGMGFAMLLNYGAVVLFPETGLQPHSENWSGATVFGSWRGVMTDKNLAGAQAAICFLLFVFDTKHMPKVVRFGMLLISGIFLYKTNSKTSVGLAGIAAVLGLVYERVNYRLRIYLIPLGILTGVAVWMGLMAFRFRLLEGGLSPHAFTGRGQIWAVLIYYARDHLWTGTGFGSFWNVGGVSPVFEYGHGFATTVSVGHDGYLDLLAATGLPGLVLGVFAVMVWPMARILGSEKISLSKGGMLCGMLMFCIGHNFTESSLLDRDALTGVMAMFLACFAAYSLPTKRSSRSSGRSSGESSGKSRRKGSDGGSAKRREAGQQLFDEIKARKGR